MDQHFDDTVHDVASRLEADIPYLQPAGESHFVGEAALFALGSAVVVAYMNGVLAAAKEEAEAWGKRSVGWLKERISAAFGDDEPGQRTSETIEVVTEYRQVVKTASGDQLASWVTSSTSILELALIENELPANTAKRAVEAARAL